MRILLYNDLDSSGLKKQFDKVCRMLYDEDFRSAEIKKLTPGPYYRAKLDYSNRLLFRFARIGDESCILVLEVIRNHKYENSRFLNGAVVDETKLVDICAVDDIKTNDIMDLSYVHRDRRHFNLLDKILVFDDAQDDVSRMKLPLIIIGSAGSGKTVLSLEKLKLLKGDILYVTHSPFLVENSRIAYYSHRYTNEKQNLDFLSFSELLQTISVPDGREIDYTAFSRWFSRHRQGLSIKDPHRLYEEFKGVLTGADPSKPFLSLDDYLQLGVKRSIFLDSERHVVYDIFQKYLSFLKNDGFFDSSMLAHEYLRNVNPCYDYAVIDEVQDLTNTQIQLVLKMLRNPTSFILSGDSNQIVHPNFFSWSQLKSMFYESRISRPADIIRILHSNYRNSPEITELANRLLLVKNLRFGSIDRESNYLVKSVRSEGGKIEFLPDSKGITSELNRRTAQSTRFAVLVPRDADKKDAAKRFNTPLLFSIHQAKGLEYENVILYNFVSGNAAEYREVAADITIEDLQQDLTYARAKDKTDKSLETYKFYINSLYVAVTRAVSNIYIIENNARHPLLNLLGLSRQSSQVTADAAESTFEEWLAEARRLELQGKTEQAAAIRRRILRREKVPWEVIDNGVLENLKRKAFDTVSYNRKAKALLCEYAALHGLHGILNRLAAANYGRAANLDVVRKEADMKHNQVYHDSFERKLKNNIRQFGIDYRDQFNRTPLMGAVQVGNCDSAESLLRLGANPDLIGPDGLTPFRQALKLACNNSGYAARKLPKIYHLLQDSSVKVKAGNHMIKLGNQLMEFFMLNCLMTVLPDIVLDQLEDRKRFLSPFGFKATELEARFSRFPDSVLPSYRKKRSYISSMLSKNEAGGSDRYCRKLFFRITQGFYVFNPMLEVMTNGKWVNIYTLILKGVGDTQHLPAAFRRFIAFVKMAAEVGDANGLPDYQVVWGILQVREFHKLKKLYPRLGSDSEAFTTGISQFKTAYGEEFVNAILEDRDDDESVLF